MTPNTHFNSYKEGLDLEFLRAYCMEYWGREYNKARKMEIGKCI